MKKSRWTKLNGLTIPTDRRQSSWLCTCAAEELNPGITGTNPAGGQSGTWTQGLQISNPVPSTPRPTDNDFHSPIISCYKRVLYNSKRWCYTVAAKTYRTFKKIKFHHIESISKPKSMKWYKIIFKKSHNPKRISSWQMKPMAATRRTRLLHCVRNFPLYFIVSHGHCTKYLCPM